MFEPKPMASLSGGLLARKGDARPAIRRAYVPLTTVAPLPVSVQKETAPDEQHDDLGWNDLGAAVSAPSSPPPVVRQHQERIARTFLEPAEKARAEATAPLKARTAFTLRLDPERHLRLRLASAVGRRSAQRIVTQALDAFLDQQPGLDALVAEVRRSVPGDG